MTIYLLGGTETLIHLRVHSELQRKNEPPNCCHPSFVEYRPKQSEALFQFANTVLGSATFNIHFLLCRDEHPICRAGHLGWGGEVFSENLSFAHHRTVIPVGVHKYRSKIQNRVCICFVCMSRTHARARAHTHTHTHTRACTHTHLHTHTYTNTLTHTHTPVRARARVHTHARARARAHTHTHTHTNTLMYRYRKSPKFSAENQKPVRSCRVAKSR